MLSSGFSCRCLKLRYWKNGSVWSLAYRVAGKNTHDARLVAAMVVHGVSSILTFNIQDFTRYAEITIFDPRTLT